MQKERNLLPDRNTTYIVHGWRNVWKSGRGVGRGEVAIGGHNLPPGVNKGLTYLQKSGGACTPCPLSSAIPATLYKLYWQLQSPSVIDVLCKLNDSSSHKGTFNDYVDKIFLFYSLINMRQLQILFN